MIPPEAGFREYIAIRYILSVTRGERKEVSEKANMAKSGRDSARRARGIGVLDANGVEEDARKCGKSKGRPRQVA
jgi:hypothetical protein